MIAELRLHGTDDLALVGREDRLVEGLLLLALGDGGQLAALRLGGLFDRVLLGDGLPRLAAVERGLGLVDREGDRPSRSDVPDDAMLREAEEWASKNDGKQVEAVLSQLPVKFPKGDNVAEAMWRLGWRAWSDKKYDDAITSLNKAITLDQQNKKPNVLVQAVAGNALGQAYAEAGKYTESDAAYDAAAKADPKNAAMYYTNETIMMDRAAQVDMTVKAADKAIAANPKDALAYYLKGKALINKATVDPKTNKITAPPGCVEAYQMYLKLDPTGPFSGDAKAVLQSLGEKVESSVRNRR